MDGPSYYPPEQLQWAAVDFDGTLATDVWTPETPYALGLPIRHNVVKLLVLVELGYKVIIHTARPWSDYKAVESWLDYYQIPYSRIICGKLLAAVYIDDRGVHSDDPDWTPRDVRSNKSTNELAA